TKNYFKANYSNNPVNLLNQCEVCKNPQPRYKLNSKHGSSTPPFKYLSYQQCLPGCVVEKNKIFKVKITFTSTDEHKIVELTNYILCKPYDGGSDKTQQLSKAGNQSRSEDPVRNSLDQGKKSRV
ncbi:Hypothetical predicted protein, partial [Paramuricea clavata]